MEKKIFYRSKAPLRISLGGGGTDVSPYPEEKGGAILNTTISKYAYCTIYPREDNQITVKSLDFKKMYKWKVKDTFEYDGNLDLVKVVLNHFNVNQGCDIYLHCDAPPGSGLGSSSTVIVSIIGAVSSWLSIPMSSYETANLAYVLERKNLAMIGGKQDQYAATFGGFNFMEFEKDDVTVTPLRIRKDVLNELHYRMILLHTGKTRNSGNIIENQRSNYKKKNVDTMRALDNIKEIAGEMRKTLLKGNIDKLAKLLDESWQNKKHFTSNISNEYIDSLYQTAIDSGAVGGKISGAGGGGFMFFICDFDKKHIVSEKLESLGAESVDFIFEGNGLQTWRCDK